MHTTQMHSFLYYHVIFSLFLTALWVRNDLPTCKKPPVNDSAAYFDSYFKRRSIFAQIYGRENNSDLASIALSVNGVFTETDGIMAWAGAGGEPDNGFAPLSF